MILGQWNFDIQVISCGYCLQTLLIPDETIWNLQVFERLKIKHLDQLRSAHDGGLEGETLIEILSAFKKS